MLAIKHPRCAGLDVHQRQITVCRVTPGAGNELQTEVRTFGTMTRDLLALSDWLTAGGCTQVVLESTGVGVPSGPSRSTTSWKAASPCCS